MDVVIKNSIVALMREAAEKNWCTQPGCTTCGSTEYRSALRSLNSEGSEGLSSALASLDLGELERLPGWTDPLQLALAEAAAANQLDPVLESWLPEIRHHPRIADLVLFHFVRRGALFAGMSLEVLKAWKNNCVEIAIRTEDASLLESLLYTAPDALKDNPLGLEAAKRVGRHNPAVRRALHRNW